MMIYAWSNYFYIVYVVTIGNLSNNMKLTRIMNGGGFMISLLVVLCIIGIIMLLSRFLPYILRAIPAAIGLIVLTILIGFFIFIIFVISFFI